MNFHIITLFPEVIDEYTHASVLGRAQKEKKISVKTYQLRDFVRNNKWGKVDERPYGGGPGMVLQAEPIIHAVKKIQKKINAHLRKQKTSSYQNAKKKFGRVKIIVTAAGGKSLTNLYAKKLSRHKNIIIICGRYEGIDARVKKILKAEEISIGPYILTGGEIPALAIMDATARQLPGVLGKFESVEENRVSSRETYTRPEVIACEGYIYRVPKILLSGDRGKIEAWKLKRRHPLR